MDLENQYRKAVRLSGQNRFNDALAILEEILKQDPAHAPALNKSGIIYFRLGKRDVARDYFQRALEVDDKFVPALGNLAALLQEEGEGEQANALLQQVATLLDASYHEACQLLSQNRFKDALALLEEILRQDPDHALALNKLGVIHVHLEEKEKAREFFQRAIAADAQCAPALGNLGCLMMEEGLGEQAYDLLRRAAELDQDNPYILNNLATLHKRRGEIEQYLSVYKKSQRLFRDRLKKEARDDWHNIRKRSGCASAIVLALGLVTLVAIAWLV